MKFTDYDYLSIYCIRFSHNFGYVPIKKGITFAQPVVANVSTSLFSLVVLYVDNFCRQLYLLAMLLLLLELRSLPPHKQTTWKTTFLQNVGSHLVTQLTLIPYKISNCA